MLDSLVLSLEIIFLLSSIILLSLQRDKRDVIFKRLSFRRCRESGSRTPPRSFSPEKRRTQHTSTQDYSATFPPSRRFNVVDSGLSSTSTEAVTTSILDWTKRILPIETSFLEAPNGTFTPCEFSIAEIQALGDFPNYSALSGVPLPEPYHTFDIRKALPRPYRPIRWAYHQTMCKSARI